MNAHTPNQKMFNIPPATLWLCGILIGVALLRMVLPAETEGRVLFYGLFIPLRITELNDGYWTFLSYGFFHHGFMHLAINTGMIVAMGSLLERLTGSSGFILTFGMGCIGGALAFWAYDPSSQAPLIGASGGLTALLGAAAIIMRHTFRFDPRSRMLIILVAIGVAFDLFNALAGSSGIGWQAHLGGLATGLLIGFGMTRMIGPAGRY